MISRRHFGRLALATLPTAATAGKIGSPVSGVRLGVSGYSFQALPLDAAIAAMARMGLGETEVWFRHIEPKLPREQLREWLDAHGLSPDDQLAILVSVGEACTNAVEHAYNTEGRNLFRVEACCGNGQVLCCVTDSGAWKDNATRNARGNGVTIMNELMDDVSIERRTAGTAVTLTYRLGTRNASALQH